MSTSIRCPNPECRQAYRVQAAGIGQRAVCKRCGHEFQVGATGGDTQGREGETDGDPVEANPGMPDRTIPAQLGRFQIRCRVGAGGFGLVYRAHDPVLDREVALKVLRAGLLDKPQARARFLREPKAAAQLRHPHIVPVYEAGSADGESYIASAFIAGRTLESAIDEGPMGFPQAARIVQQLAEALEYAHSLGIVHRDVKPANIMLGERGEPLLMDFGLARLEYGGERLTHDGAVMGTPSYNRRTVTRVVANWRRICAAGWRTSRSERGGCGFPSGCGAGGGESKSGSNRR